jgi:hypothetical protein
VPPATRHPSRSRPGLAGRSCAYRAAFSIVLGVRSPKLAGSVQHQYYRYYAGYTQGFVEDMLHRLRVSADDLVLDPWNGGGTTTVAAVAAGVNAIGFDINPAAVIIGRARLLGSDVANSIVPIAVEICDRARTHSCTLHRDDLLNTWFGPATAQELRALERACFRILVDSKSDDSSPIFDPALQHSSLASVFYVALFRTVRELVRKYVPSNPSWIKHSTGRRIGITQSELHAAFVAAVKVSNPFLGQLELPMSTADAAASVAVASSAELPLGDASVDAIVSSPPYCTRLDYVKATLPELAIMGLTAINIRSLRDQMIGTPTVSGAAKTAKPGDWGKKANDLIHTIAMHESKASATYYRKYYVQYFAGMWGSLIELKRVVRPKSFAALVVQDSFYKDVHVDLPALIGDMSEAAGWAGWERLDFAVAKTMASIHPGARRYRQDFGAVESAVILQR